MQPVHAAISWHWNPGGSGGDGNWSTGPADTNWNTVPGALDNSTWPNSADSVAVFQDGTGGTVTVFGGVDVASIVQDGSSYQLVGGSLNLIQGSGGETPSIGVISGTLSISSALAGVDGLVKSGAGTLILSGSNSLLGSTSVTGGSLVLAAADQLSDSDALTLSGGSIILDAGDETVGTLVSTGGTVAGSGVLQAGSYQLGDGTTISGNLGSGVLSSSGNVSISGNAAAAQVNVGAGTLTLSGGNLNSSASLLLSSGGTLQLQGNQSVAGLVSNGGSVAGSGTLTAATYALGNGSTISGYLGSGTLDSSGNVALSGSSLADVITISSGVLTNTGTLGHAGSAIDISGGARLIASGVQNYSILTSSGTGAGIWQGNLGNTGIIRPGDSGSVGSLSVIGNFSNLAGGTLSFDISAGGSDLLTASGSAVLSGTLELNKLGAAEIAAFVPVQIIAAGSYSGNFSSLQEDLAGVVLFNPLNGSITRLGGAGEGELLAGATINRASTFTALYDDVIDPGTSNVAYRPGLTPPFALQSGIASDEDPRLLWALSASITPGGLNAALLDRLSPEVYAGLGDYAGQATRTHRRTAFQAPALASAGGAPAASGGAKDAKAAIAAPAATTWEIFAAADYFDGETSGSIGNADYELSGGGVVAGARISPRSDLRFAAFLAGDDGDLRGNLIDADARGVAGGLIGEWMIEDSRALRLSGGISFGSHRFEGTRSSASASTAGWSPGFASFTDVDTDTLDIFVGLDGVAWKNDRFRVIPGIGLEYRNTSTEAFREFSGSTSGPISLAVDGASRDSLVTDFNLAAEADVTRALMLDGRLGFNLELNEDAERISARFIGGSRPMSALTTPLSDELFYFATGATWTASESVRVRLGYRLELRSDADPLNEINLGTSFRF